LEQRGSSPYPLNAAYFPRAEAPSRAPAVVTTVEPRVADATSLSWRPESTWVFVVGTLEWQHPETFPSFPQENRRDLALVKHFHDQGVPAGHITYLKDAEATTANIQRALERHLAGAGADDLLVLYFCGHGAKLDGGATYFASYDCDLDQNPGWHVDSIPTTIDCHFAGSRALLLADCCYSGQLAEALDRQPRRVGFACLTSSLASQLSTGNWTFTEGLLYGLRGQSFVDADGSHQVTLRELADQIVADMAFADEQLATFALRGGFDPGFVVAAARPRSGPELGRRVEVRDGRAWYPALVVDARDGRLRVHYFGYEESDDEWIDKSRIREAQRPTYPVGASVEVQWKERWFPATILDVHDGVHQIGYVGFGPEWNEWVARRRIRPAG
jgi:hypothetical protein